MTRSDNSGTMEGAPGSKRKGLGVAPIFFGLMTLVLSATILVESRLQLSGRSFLVKYLNESGLVSYQISKEPNKGIWLATGWTAAVCFGLLMFYSVRRRFKFMAEAGQIKSWLDGHMFLGLLGAALATAHTMYRFGGFVSVGYWSMVLVTASGLLGRYLYVHIPHGASGDELKREEMEAAMTLVNNRINMFKSGGGISSHFDAISTELPPVGAGSITSLISLVAEDIENVRALKSLRGELNTIQEMTPDEKEGLYEAIKEKRNLIRTRRFLDVSQKLYRFWHVFHRPFAVVTIVVLLLHIGVYLWCKV